MLFTGWTILGLIIYMVYGRKHSLLQKESSNS
jgi:APA family basic amino acid/polyamine antiporter